jgi:hypothetical protein
MKMTIANTLRFMGAAAPAATAPPLEAPAPVAAEPAPQA